MKTGRAEKQATAGEVAGQCRRLYAEHDDHLYRFCFRLCGRADDAEEDVVLHFGGG